MAEPTSKAKRVAMSFEELMTGVGAGHRMLAAQPGAMRYPERTIKPGMPELELLRERYQKGWFKTPSGEDLRPEVKVRSTPLISRSSEEAKIATGRLPDYSFIDFLNPSGASAGRVYIKKVDLKDIGRDDPAAMEMYNKLRASSKDTPRIFNFDASMMPEAIGRPVYQTLYDMMRAGNYLNYADTLSQVNQMRRPGNVMSYGLTHGDYENVPLFPSLDNTNPFVPGYGYRTGVEEEVLRRAVMPRAGYDKAIGMTPRHFNQFSTDAKTGLLALKEMQMAKAHGSPFAADLGAELGKHYVFPQAHPMDMGQLAQYARRAREEGAGSMSDLTRIATEPGSRRPLPASPDEWGPHRGMSSHLFGKVGTTEALLGGLQSGLKPEDVLEELLQYPGAFNAIKGRYKKGGLVAALQG